MQRRGFLSAILMAASAPAIVKAGSIMTINPRQGLVVLPMEIGRIDGFRIIAGDRVVYQDTGVEAVRPHTFEFVSMMKMSDTQWIIMPDTPVLRLASEEP